MKLTVERDALVDALSVVRSRASGNAIAILNHICLSAKDSKITVLAHDMESSCEAKIAADVQAEGACAIPAETAFGLIQSMPKGGHILINDSGPSVTIKCGRSRYSLPSMPADDMPLMLAPEGGCSFDLDDDGIAQLFERPSGPVLAKCPGQIFKEGIYLAADDAGKLSALGTDGIRFLRFSTELDIGEAKPVIVPLFAVKEIAKIGGGRLQWSDRILSITTDKGVTFATKLIDVPYPNIFPKLPKPEGPYLQFDRQELLTAIARLALIPVWEAQFRWGDKAEECTIRLSRGGDGSELVSCEQHGTNAGDIAVPAYQLAKTLAALRGKAVKLFIKNRSTPIRIVDVDEPSALAIQVPCYASAELDRYGAAAA